MKATFAALCFLLTLLLAGCSGSNSPSPTLENSDMPQVTPPDQTQEESPLPTGIPAQEENEAAVLLHNGGLDEAAAESVATTLDTYFSARRDIMNGRGPGANDTLLSDSSVWADHVKAFWETESIFVLECRSQYSIEAVDLSNEAQLCLTVLERIELHYAGNKEASEPADMMAYGISHQIVFSRDVSGNWILEKDDYSDMYAGFSTGK